MEESSITNNGKKKRRTKKDLSMMELIEQVKSHKSRVLQNVNDSGRQMPNQRNYPQTTHEEYWNKQYSDSDDDFDEVQSEPVRVEKPPRPTTARGRRRVSVDLSVSSSVGSETGGLDSPRFEEYDVTPTRASQNKVQNKDSQPPPRSKSRLGNHRPLRYQKDLEPTETPSTNSQGQKGPARNLPPLSKELSSLDPYRQSSSLSRPVSRLGRESSRLSSIQTRSSRPENSLRRSLQSQGHSDIYSVDRQRTIVLDSTP